MSVKLLNSAQNMFIRDQSVCYLEEVEGYIHAFSQTAYRQLHVVVFEYWQLTVVIKMNETAWVEISSNSTYK
jgi:hypothetical protein